MTDFGQYRLSYEPGPHDPYSGVLDHTVEMSISGEADLPQLVSFFGDFLKATGYQFESLTVEKSKKDLEFNNEVDNRNNDYWDYDGSSVVGNPWPMSFGSGLPGAEGSDHIYVKSSHPDTYFFS